MKKDYFIDKMVKELEWELTSVKGQAIGIFGETEGLQITDKIITKLIKILSEGK